MNEEILIQNFVYILSSTCIDAMYICNQLRAWFPALQAHVISWGTNGPHSMCIKGAEYEKWLVGSEGVL